MDNQNESLTVKIHNLLFTDEEKNFKPMGWALLIVFLSTIIVLALSPEPFQPSPLMTIVVYVVFGFNIICSALLATLKILLLCLDDTRSLIVGPHFKTAKFVLDFTVGGVMFMASFQVIGTLAMLFAIWESIFWKSPTDSETKENSDEDTFDA